MHKLLFVLPLLFVAACNTEAPPDVRWAQAQSFFNAAKTQAINARRPCVDSVLKEADPGCLIKAEQYPLVSAVIHRGDATLEAAEQGSPLGDTLIDVLLLSAEEILRLLPAK